MGNLGIKTMRLRVRAVDLTSDDSSKPGREGEKTIAALLEALECSREVRGIIRVQGCNEGKSVVDAVD